MTFHNIFGSSNLMATSYNPHNTNKGYCTIPNTLYANLKFLEKVLYLRFTVSLHNVFAVPIEFVASQTY